MGIKNSTQKLNVSQSRVHYKKTGVGRRSHSLCACVRRTRPMTDSPLQVSKSHLYSSNSSFSSWESIPSAPQLPKGCKWHVQFICSVKDLHVVDYANRYLSRSGYRCVELDSYDEAGKTEIELIDEFTSMSSWNIIIASRSVSEDGLGYQIDLAVDQARKENKKNIIVIYTDDGAIPDRLLPFKTVKRNKRKWLAHLVSIISKPPAAFLMAEESHRDANQFEVGHKRKSRLRNEVNRSSSDDLQRAKRLEFLRKMPFYGDSEEAQHQREMRACIKYPVIKKRTTATGGQS